MKKLHLVKIGGNVLDDEEALTRFLDDFAVIPGPKVLVHGGGKGASALSRALGIEPKLIDGRRITDAATLKIVTMFYAGLINKTIVAGLQGRGCNAWGICGADGDIMPAKKREHPTIDYGFVGDVSPDVVHVKRLWPILEDGTILVMSAITHDGRGQLLNTNADTVASTLAIALAKYYKVQLTFCFEKDGVLLKPEDDSSVIQRLTAVDYEAFKERGIITGGMLPKLDNAFSALTGGVATVRIKHALKLHGPGGTELLKTTKAEPV